MVADPPPLEGEVVEPSWGPLVGIFKLSQNKGKNVHISLKIKGTKHVLNYPGVFMGGTS